MVNPDVKRWLLADEEKRIKKEGKIITRPLLAVSVFSIIGILWQLAALAKTLMHSYLQPDYAAFFIQIGLLVLVGVLAITAANIYISRKCSHINMLRAKENEDAYIAGQELVLKGTTDGKEMSVRIPLSAITALESKDGRTSFTYRDNEGKTVSFSCLDYYSPQIAALLVKQGIR